MDDTELVARLMRGDPAAQLELIERYSERLTEQLLRHFEILDDAALQDIVHDVLYKLILQPERVDLAKGDPGGLLYTMAYRRATDQVRSLKRALGERRLISFDDYAETIDAEDPPADLQVDSAEEEANAESAATPLLYSAELLAAAQAVMAVFEDAERDVEHIRLRLEAKLLPVEIARLLGLDANNERVRWHRLKKKLNSEWAKYPVLVEYARLHAPQTTAGLLTITQRKKPHTSIN